MWTPTGASCRRGPERGFELRDLSLQILAPPSVPPAHTKRLHLHLQPHITNYVADTFQALRNSKHRIRRRIFVLSQTALLPQIINFVADFSFFLGCVLRDIRGDERRLRGADQRGVGGPART